MAQLAIEFSDYHRTVIGYHGTTVEAADRLIAGEPFQPSDQDDEWFGKGLYFWEHAFQQAWTWAKQRHPSGPAVVGAVIRLGDCFDLLDPSNVDTLKRFYIETVESMSRQGLPVPVNVLSHKYLDCAVFDQFCDVLQQVETPLDTIRGVYVPTGVAKRIYKGSWISAEAHIQICVRNPRSVLALWHVREDGRYGRPAAG